jgi:hypothetical protein
MSEIVAQSGAIAVPAGFRIDSTWILAGRADTVGDMRLAQIYG